MENKSEQRKKVVLVVEDDRPLLEAIKIKLENSGFDALTARTTDEAYNFLQDVPHVDAIWLDHYLIGKESGLDFVVKVKSNDAWKKMPIFVVSNTATGEKVQAYLQLGINKYYVKSDFRLDQIIGDVKSYFDTEQSE